MLHALADGDVSQVLVALSALLAGGWGPQQLATELIDDLRQVFLSALAPELCAASGSSLERFTAVAEMMGLPRVVRSMEILGHALVDMREAPDAQVVLEISIVRAVRPDLDSGMEALSERVSLLERALSGGAAFPRPGAAAEPAAHAAPAAARRPPPVASAGGAPGDVGKRPSIGAVRRSQQASGAAVAPPPGTGPSVPDPGPSEPATAPEPAPKQAARTATAHGASVVDRDSLTEAWGDGILRALPARAKALYSAGRFVSVDEHGADFALPNVAHRERCADLVPTVEAALAAHFGTPVTLVLDVDEATAPAAGAASGRPTPRGDDPGAGANDDEMDHVDPADLLPDAPDAPTDQASAAEARLLEAFPGASEVAG